MNLDTRHDRALTVAEAAEFLNTTEIAVLDLIHRQVIAASNIGKGSQRPRWRILSSDLGKFLLSTRPMPLEETPRRSPRRKAAVKDYFA